MVFEGLRSRAVDFEKPLQVEHVFYVTSEESAARVSLVLRADNYQVSAPIRQPTPDEGPQEWEMRATCAMVVSEAIMHDLRGRMEA